MHSPLTKTPLSQYPPGVPDGSASGGVRSAAWRIGSVFSGRVGGEVGVIIHCITCHRSHRRAKQYDRVLVFVAVY